MILTSLTLFSRFYGGFAYKPVYWVEWCIASIFALNALYHIIQYTWATLSLKPIALSPKQRPLLGISEDDPLFKDEVPQKQTTPEPSPSLNLSCINLSRRSTPLGSLVLSDISMQNTFFYCTIPLICSFLYLTFF